MYPKFNLYSWCEFVQFVMFWGTEKISIEVGIVIQLLVLFLKKKAEKTLALMPQIVILKKHHLLGSFLKCQYLCPVTSCCYIGFSIIGG